MVIDVVRSSTFKFVIALLAVSMALVFLAAAANTRNVQKLPVQQPGVKTAPVNAPQRQGIAQPYQPTINPTQIPTIIVTPPPPTPTFRRAPIPMPSYVGVNPGWGVTPTPMPTFRHVPFPSVQVGPAEPATGIYQPQPYPP